MGLDMRAQVDGELRFLNSEGYKQYLDLITGARPVSHRIIVHLDRPLTEDERRSNLRLLKGKSV